MGLFDFLSQAKDAVTDMASQAGVDDIAGQASDAASNATSQASDAVSNVTSGAADQAQTAAEDATQKVEDAKNLFNQE